MSKNTKNGQGKANEKDNTSIAQKIREIVNFFGPLLNKRDRRNITILSVLLIITGTLTLAGADFTGRVVTYMKNDDNIAYVIAIAIGVGYFLKHLVRAWTKYFRGKIFNRLLTESGVEIFSRTINSNIALFSKFKTEDIMSRRREISALPQTLQEFFAFIGSFVNWILAVIYTTSIHWGFIVLQIVTTLIMLWIIKKPIEKIIQMKNDLKDVQATAGQRIRESMIKFIDTKLNGSIAGCIKSVFNLENDCKERRDEINKLGLTKISMRVSFVDHLKSTSFKVLAIYLIKNGYAEIGFFTALAAFSGAFDEFEGKLINFFTELLPNTHNSIQRIKQLEEFKADEFGEKSLDKVDTLEVKDVTFTYDGKDKPQLKNINFNLKRGQIGAIVGKSACGKSTLASIICGLHRPQEGKVFYNGINVNDLNAECRYKLIGMVKQASDTFEGTVRDQFSMLPSYSEEAMMAACKVAQIHDQIMSLVEYEEDEKGEKTVKATGYDCKLSEHVKNFSGGQKQRLAFAVVIMQNPDIIILDEATSAQDAETQKRILDEFYELFKDKIVIVIAHRLCTITGADVIYIMDKGEFAGHGSFKEMYQSCKLFKRFVDSETGGLPIDLSRL